MRLPDLSLAFRNIFRRPGFAIVAITLLALGAGANAAVFSVVRGVLLRPLAFPEPDRLVAVGPQFFISNEEMDYWRTRTRSFEHIAAISPGWMMGLVAEGGEPIKVTGGRVSDNMFQALGARAALGRTIEPGDAKPGAPQVVVISHGLWRTRFNSDPHASSAAAFSSIEQPYTIVGVMPDGFEIFEPRHRPLGGAAVGSGQPQSQGDVLARRGAPRPRRRRPRRRRASSSISRRRCARTSAKANDWGQTLRVQSLQESITGDVRPALLILLGAVGLILMLAAVNLGTLVLGRSIERVGEMALRTALGASRGRLVRQIVIGTGGAGHAGAIAGIARRVRWRCRSSSRAFPPKCHGSSEIALDWTVLVSVLAGSVSVAVVVALLPAVITARPNLQPLLRQSRTTDTPARRRALGALVAVQIGLAVVLGIGSMLMLRSMWNLQRVDPGFDPNNVLTFRLQTTSKYRDMTRGAPYLQQVTRSRRRRCPA